MEDQPPTGGATRRRLTVARAADVLGISVEAVRGRIKRDTLAHEKSKDGTVYVLLDTDQLDQARPALDQSQSDATALISEMRAHNATLREQLEAERQAHAEARRIIAGLVERIPPALEAPSEEPPESPETATEETGRGTEPPDLREAGAEPRSWWRRMFGG